jgi:hypothetical protein
LETFATELWYFSWYYQRDELTIIRIRSIEEADLPSVARLLNVLSREFIVRESTPEGAATFAYK